jgi:hypothetical protein
LNCLLPPAEYFRLTDPTWWKYSQPLKRVSFLKTTRRWKKDNYTGCFFYRARNTAALSHRRRVSVPRHRQLRCSGHERRDALYVSVQYHSFDINLSEIRTYILAFCCVLYVMWPSDMLLTFRCFYGKCSREGCCCRLRDAVSMMSAVLDLKFVSLKVRYFLCYILKSAADRVIFCLT